MLFKFRFGNCCLNPLKFMAPHPQHNKIFSGPLSFSLPSIFSQGCFMLEDAYKSCPDVICIRAGISVQLSVVANVYFNGLLCNPCRVDLSGLICMFSAVPVHCFQIYNFSPKELLLVTRGTKNVTPVVTQKYFYQCPRVDFVLNA